MKFSMKHKEGEYIIANQSAVTNCACCGNLIFVDTEVCPWCEQSQADWQDGERIMGK